MNNVITEIDNLINVLKGSFYTTEDEKEAHWKAHVTQAEAFEKPIIAVIPDVFSKARHEALQAVKQGKHHVHIDRLVIHKVYKEKVTPILHECLTNAIKNGNNLVKPQNPHKVIPPVVSTAAIEWLKTRMGWAATQIGETLADDLAQSLAAGYAQGESIADLTTRVMDFFDNPARAERIARTETITASNQGAIFGYQDANLDQCEFYCALDERVCEICLSLHGQIFNLEDATNVITGSTHPDCRCCWLPVLKPI